MASQIQSSYKFFHGSDGKDLDLGYIYIGEYGFNPEANPINVFWDESLTIPAAQPIRTISGFPSNNGTPGKLYVSEIQYSLTVRDKQSNLVLSDLAVVDPDSTLRADLANTIDLTKGSALVGRATEIYASKAVAITRTPVSGRLYYIGGSDGGLFVGVTGAAPATYADNGGSYCGTQFIPSGGDGSAAWVRFYEGDLNVKWFGAQGDGVTDDKTSFQNAGEHAHSIGGAVIDVPPGSYLVSSSVTFTGWRGVTFKGVGAAQGYSLADAGGGGPTNTGKSSDIITNTNIAAFYGTQGTSATDRTRNITFERLHFTGNSATLGSANYGVHWHQDNVSIFSGFVDFIDCHFQNFEHGIRVTAVSGIQATGWWSFTRTIAQDCYWGLYAPGGINSCVITDGLFYQNDDTAATTNIFSDPHGGGIYGVGTGWNIKGVDIEGQAVGISLVSVTGFEIGGCYFEGTANRIAQIMINSCRDGTILSTYAADDEIVIANSQAITVSPIVLSTIRIYGQNRDLNLPKSRVFYDNTGGLTPDNHNISIETQNTYRLFPEVIGNKNYRTIIAETVIGTATIDNASADINSPFGGPTVTKVTTTGASQYARTFLSNGAWAINQWVNGIMFLYVPTAFTGTLTVSLMGSGGTEASASIGLYPRDAWFAVKLHAKASAASTSTDFRVTIGNTGQVIYMYRPTAFIADIDIEPFVTYKFADPMDAQTVEPVLFPGNTIYLSNNSAYNRVMWGTGDPNTVITGRVGDLFLRTDGGTGTVLYVKEIGAGTTGGWAAK